MLERIRKRILYSLSLIDKNQIKLITFLIILLNFFFLRNITDNYGTNLVLFENDIYSVILQLLFFVLLIFMIVNNFKGRYTILTRYSDKDDAFKSLFLNITFVVSIVYLLIVILFLISLFINTKCNILDSAYSFYEISSIKYGIWGMLRNYSYIIFITFIITYYSIYSNNSFIVYLIVFLFFSITFIIYFNYSDCYYFRIFLGYHISLNDFGSFTYEILNYVMYTIFKLGILILILRLVNSMDIFFNKISINLDYLKYNFYNVIKKKNIILFFIYISCSIFGAMLYGLKYQTIIFNILSLSRLPLLWVFSLLAIMLCFIQLTLNIFLYDIDRLCSFIFTRISRKEWFFYKTITLVIIWTCIRGIIYLITGFTLYVLYDWIIHIILIIQCGFVALKGNIVSYILLWISIIIMLLSDINIYVICLLLALLFVGYANCKKRSIIFS